MWSRLIAGSPFRSEHGVAAPRTSGLGGLLPEVHLGFPGPISWAGEAAAPDKDSQAVETDRFECAGWAGAAEIVIDEDGRIADADHRAASLFSGAVKNVQLVDLCALDDRTALAAALDSNAPAVVKVTPSQSPGNLPAEMDAKDGAQTLELRFAGGGTAFRCVLVIDRSKEEHALAEARREAKLNLDLLADLSHEMRTPLNAVIGFADAMREETFGPLGSPKYLEYADHIAMSGGHLKDLVTAILDLARLEARGPETDRQRETTDLGALARNCAAMLDAPAREAGLSLSVEVEEGVPLSHLNARAVRQILINLLTNAVKFTSDGGISLRVAPDADDKIAITVADTGIGMSAEELARLGARFTSVHGKGVRGTGGAGLGLALAFALAEAEGGALTLDSAPGEGLTAKLELPVRAAPKRERVEADAQNGAAAIQSQLDRIEVLRREINARKQLERDAAA